jgi:hypothetical protein
MISTMVIVLAACAVAAFVTFRADRAARVATGIVSHTLCSEIFVAGRDPEQSFAETFEPMGSLRHVRYAVDRTHRRVTATLGGLFESRAVYREGFGCRPKYTSAPDSAVSTAPPATAEDPVSDTQDIAGSAVVEPADERLRVALDRAFAESEGGPQRAAKVIVIMHEWPHHHRARAGLRHRHAVVAARPA